MKIGKYLTTDDITKSQTAVRKNIVNYMTAEQQEAAKYLAEKVYDIVKDKFPEAFVSSFFRCDKLNLAIGGAKGSQHAKGEAVDIDSTSHNNIIFGFIKDTLEYDQVIAEFPVNGKLSWVHVSLKKTGNRKQVLIATKVKGKTVYLTYSGNERLIY
jgi:zinc D-Ala-D-Ala carboxypeptidase